jgi:hypothetical protein
MTSTTSDLANVPHPGGAVYVADWDNDAEPRRYFRGTSWFVDRDGPIDHDITVEIYGSQGTSGDVSRHIMLTDGEYERMELSSSDHARQFGLALLDAADEMDRLTQSRGTNQP